MTLRDTLNKRLGIARPSRYQSTQWVDDVADSLTLDEAEVRTAAAEYVRSVARDVEGKATRAGNRLMREFHRNQCLPLDWKQYASAPISLQNVVIIDGQAKAVNERVKLSDATPTDFELWAETENRARERDYTARGEAVTGALEIASRMRSDGALNFGTWAQLQGESVEAA